MKVFTLAFTHKINLQPDNNIPKDTNGITPLTFIAEQPNSTVMLTKQNSPTVDGLQYRTADSDDWLQYIIDTKITLTNSGDYVQFKNTKNTLNRPIEHYAQFVMTGKIKATGNIQSLLNYSDTVSTQSFSHLFINCTQLTKAPELPATTLASQCYWQMFKGCTGLTNAPELPAKILGMSCYDSMFEGCSGLITAPELPATTLAENCYARMFKDCTSLTTAPELPSDKGRVDGCYYYMFANCTSLNYIKVGFITFDTMFTSNWVSNVSQKGTFVCPDDLDISYGDSYVPVGWTVQTGSSQEQPPAEDEDPVGEAQGITISDTGTKYDGNYYISDRTFYNQNDGTIRIQFDGNMRWALINSSRYAIAYAEGNGDETIEEICTLNWILEDYEEISNNFTITPWYR